jgi:hypothetical protein
MEASWKRQTAGDGVKPIRAPGRLSHLSGRTQQTAAVRTGADAISEYGVHAPSRVRIPPSPLSRIAENTARSIDPSGGWMPGSVAP